MRKKIKKKNKKKLKKKIKNENKSFKRKRMLFFKKTEQKIFFI
jgi:hypothetical protein